MTSVAQRRSLKMIHDDVEFYPHQIEGVRDLARMKSFLLADEMGLGKSLQALTVAAIDFEKGWASLVLIVCPAGLKANWAEEIKEHTNFKAEVLDGTPKQRNAQLDEFEDNDNEILIVNYEQVIPHLNQLNRIGFEIVVYDEAHYIKNPKAKRTKACQDLMMNRHFLLTGSPMLGHVNDLWSLLYRINPAMENYWRFLNRYAVFGGYKDKQIVGVKNRDELYERLQSVMVRRLKTDVLDLPEKQIIPIKVDLSPLQRKLYDQVLEDLLLDAPDPDGASPMEIENALTKFLRLKQICGTPAAIQFEDGEPHKDESYKLDVACEKIEEICIENQEHLIVFTQFRGVQAAMVERLQHKKFKDVPVYQLHGDVHSRDRAGIVRKWSGDKPGVIVCMLQVAGVGLNMAKASKQIFLDKLFVPKLNEQAQDRSHRIGADSTQPVQIFEMQCRNTIESRVEQILRTKKRLFDDVVETDSWKSKLYAALVEDEDE